MRRLIRGGAGAAAAIVAVAMGSSGCLMSSTPTITTTAYFHDVGNLVQGAPVEMAGITVGNVSGITLGPANLAKVQMTVDKSADVPSDVSASVEQSTVLGEEIIQLIPPATPSTGHSSTGSVGLLADNSTIHNTNLVPGIEQFVGGGTAVLGSIGASQLAALVNAGGQGFGGQAQTLRTLIFDLNNITTGYSTRTAEIRSLILSMGRLSGSLAPQAQGNAEALSKLSRTIQILSQQSDNFVGMLQGLNRLAIQGTSIMQRQMSQIDLQFQGLATLTETIAGQQQAVAELLAQLPGHNAVMHTVVFDHFVQVVDSLIVCGLPDGGSSNQAASSCDGAGAVTGPGSVPTSIPSAGGKS